MVVQQLAEKINEIEKGLYFTIEDLYEEYIDNTRSAFRNTYDIQTRMLIGRDFGLLVEKTGLPCKEVGKTILGQAIYLKL